MFTAMSHWSDLRSLPSATLSILDLHRAVALCHGYPEALDLQDWPFYMLQQFIDGVDMSGISHRSESGPG